MFQNSKSMEEEIKEIISSNGLKNYLIKKNINELGNNEQKIFDSQGNSIGIFLNLFKIENPIYLIRDKIKIEIEKEKEKGLIYSNLDKKIF